MTKNKGMGMVVAAVVLCVSATSFARGLDRTPREISGVVNLNTGSSKELALLPGVGKHTAGLIIAYREKQPFKAPGEVVKVKGVGKGIFRRIKDHISVSGPTTLAATSGHGAPHADKAEKQARSPSMKGGAQ